MMTTLLRAPGSVAAWIIVVGLVTLLGSEQSKAAAISFDFLGSSITTVNVAGTNGGTMTFRLDLGDSAGGNIDGNFSLDAKNSSGDIISSVSFLGTGDGSTQDFGDQTSSVPFFGFPWPNIAIWSVNVTSADLSPVRLDITSTLTVGPSFGDLQPLLTLDFTGDLRLSAVPLGPLPVWLTMIIMSFGGWFMWRRGGKIVQS